jgi:outer membrane protein assembly factor BamB
MGKRYFGGTGSMAPVGTHALRALDLETGNTVWEYEQVGAGRSASGALSTAGGVVFIGEDSGVFTALDAKNGTPLWHFFANDTFRASPMTYSVAGRQYVCIGDAAGFLSFALPD